jgi:hypothetical protein
MTARASSSRSSAAAVAALLLVQLAVGYEWLAGLQLATAGASAVAVVLLVNFELLAGGNFGLQLAADSFDEGPDLDTLMVGLQLALLLYGLSALPRRARTPRGLDLQPADMR